MSTLFYFVFLLGKKLPKVNGNGGLGGVGLAANLPTTKNVHKNVRKSVRKIKLAMKMTYAYTLYYN